MGAIRSHRFDNIRAWDLRGVGTLWARFSRHMELKISSSGTHGLSSPFYALFSGHEGRDTFFRSYLLKYVKLTEQMHHGRKR